MKKHNPYQTKPSHMRSWRINKRFAAILSLALLAVVAVGGTIAWLMDSTSEVKNTFDPAQVSCEVDESFDKQAKKDVRVKNTSDIDAYIRVALVAAWVDEDSHIAAVTPVQGTDYALTLDAAFSDNWFMHDGYYYCKTAVAPGEYTPLLIDRCVPLRDNDGLQLELQVISSAIQAQPATTVASVWPVTVDGSGVLSAAQ